MSENSFEKCTDSFVQWTVGNGGYTVSDKVKVIDYRNVGRGRAMVAVEDVAEGETLFEIPRGSILNVNTSALTRDYPSFGTSQLGEWEELILCMLYEMFVLGENSRWYPYFNVLPSSAELNSLIYWSDRELGLLKPSFVIERIGRGKSQEMFSKVLSYIENQDSDLSLIAKYLTWENFVYVASIIMSYSFDVEDLNPQSDEDDEIEDDDNDSEMSPDKSIKSMIPLADTLNSDTHLCNANLMYDKETLKMTAIKPIRAGEEVFNIYGEHPNSEILRRYGYVEWKGSKYDFAELPLEKLTDGVISHFKMQDQQLLRMIFDIIGKNDTINQIAEGENIILDTYDCYRDGQTLVEAILLLQTVCIIYQIPDILKASEEELTKNVERSFAKCYQLIQSGRITRQCLKAWEKSIELRISDYPSHANRELTPQTNITDITTLRDAMAHVVLQGEVEALRSCRLALRSNYKVIEDSKLLNNILKRKANSAEEDDRDGKRQKQ
ncbi:hypothetical protein Kpol_1018p68 [Vanderwaltozyma polyspora DSM 70294]|uniref:Ribosomal lysine N-methyltransferase 4 n=1 Tax=Vanderwaltozyma polyspora (strain ATCC 22028 / DSM 70294 / BCRC 21397 / CBS 2163 / NBRC 10782 / NRRL Y-8283 / UCD 57-17) TaxID=436907 RepID=A7TDR6_VANPO|nr:uncharacterized protein Kpol_1018p68 [Vanderwaltozyma polyspora DSM 70294]EDO19536.1 hypothetical protein Kpol_1018p68 [Vanderwaltozyma polyspora DSM 70294]